MTRGHWGGVEGQVPDNPTGDRPTSLTSGEANATLFKEVPSMPECPECGEEYQHNKSDQKTCPRPRCRMRRWRRDRKNKVYCICDHRKSMHYHGAGQCCVRDCGCTTFQREVRKKETA